MARGGWSIRRCVGGSCVRPCAPRTCGAVMRCVLSSRGLRSDSASMAAAISAARLSSRCSSYSPSSPSASGCKLFRPGIRPVSSLSGAVIIPLALRAGAPATPGTPLTLTLDSATTQLSNQGGTTSETTANGGLALTNGSIQIPIPTLALTPGTQSVNAGTNAILSAETDQRVVANTTVNLTSSNPAVGTVPSSVTITAGNHSVPVTVTTLSPGSTVITASLPNAGGATATATVIVSATPICNTPSAPALSAPAAAGAGASYTITWLAVTDATDYLIDEATDASFNNATTRTVTATSASYSHTT